MAKNKQQDIEQPVASSLIRSREEVKSLLENQIKAAEPLLSMQIAKIAKYDYDMFGSSRTRSLEYDGAQKDEFLCQLQVWNNMCREIFIRSFEHPNNTDLAGFDHNTPSYIISDIVEEYKSSIRYKIAYIEGFIKRLSLIPCKAETNVVKPTAIEKIEKNTKKVFVVHGHNNALKVEVARTIELLGLKAIILHEQEDFGNTIIEKFEANATDVGFAVILLTSDDLGVSKKDIAKEEKEKGYKAEYKERARQNVVFEMGYFIGKLDRAHVFELMENGVEKPGDIDGIIYTSVDEEGMWKVKLAKRLKACGYPVSIDAIV